MQYKVSELELMIEATMGKALNMDGSKIGKKGGKKAGLKKNS